MSFRPASRSVPSGRSTRLVAILGALTALGPLSIDMYLPSFPQVAADLGVDVPTVQLTLASYLAGLAVGQLLYGVLSDRFGRRRPLLAGLALYMLGALACALAPSLPLLVAARFVQAIGGCAGIVIARAVVRDHFDVAASARLYSTLMLIMGIAPILAPLLGGQLVVLGGWRAIFMVLVAAGAALVVTIASALPESLPAAARDPRPLPTQLRALFALVADRRFVRLSVAGGAMLGALFAYIAGSPFVLLELFHLDATAFALAFGGNAAGLIAASQLNRWLAVRLGVEETLLLGVRLAAVAFAALAVAAWAGAGLLVITPPLFLGVASIGLVLPNATAAAMAPFSAGAGRASAAMGTMQSLTGALTAVAVTWFADGSARPMAGVMAACAVLALVILPRPA